MALGQGPQALLTTLYRSTDCLCRRGAAMKNLAQSASPHAGENNAPLKPGTKHLTYDHVSAAPDSADRPDVVLRLAADLRPATAVAGRSGDGLGRRRPRPGGHRVHPREI